MKPNAAKNVKTTLAPKAATTISRRAARSLSPDNIAEVPPAQPAWIPSAAALSESTLRHLVFAPSSQLGDISSTAAKVSRRRS